jgi:hypothetical protein
VAVFAVDLEKAASERAIFIMLTAECGGIKPVTRRAVIGCSGDPALLVGSVQCGHQLRSLALQAIPSLFALVLKHMIKWRAGDDLTTCPAVVAG